MIASLLLVAELSVFAQNEQLPAIPAVNPDIPAVNPDIPAINPVEAIPKPAENKQEVIAEDIEYLAMSGNDLAALYRKYTGRRVIVSSAASKAEFEFIQPASPQNPLTYAQAAALLKKAATIENFIFVPDATDPNLDFLTLASAGATGKGRGFPLYTETDTLPDGDAVIIYVMNLSYIKPDEAVRTFTQIIGQFGAYGSIAAVPNAASVIITENTSLIRKLIDIKEQIDKPSSQVIHRFIDVKYADVTELSITLNELLGNDQNTTRTAGVQRAPQLNVADNASPVANSRPDSTDAASGEEAPVQIKPDARTNRIIAMGRPVDILFVEALIREFDIKTDQRNQYTRKLKFLAVADFLPIAGDALTRAFSGTGEAASTNGTQNPTATSSSRSTTGRTTASNTGGNSFGGSNTGLGSNNGNFGSGRSGGSNNRNSSSLADPQTNSAPQALIVGRNLLIANNVTNSIIVQGPPAGVEIIDKLLDQIDIKAEQVMISTVFGQLSLGNSTTTGVDWIRSFRGNDDGGVGFSNLGGSGPTGLNPTSMTDPITGEIAGTFPNQAGLSIYGKIGNSLASYINLLSTSNDFTVLSRPSIFTANNQRGTISSGRRIAIPTNSNQFSGNGVSTNIEYRDVVLKLEVIPLVNSDDEITLQIALLSDDVIGESDPIEGIGQVPIIGTRELLTTVTVPNNQTIILGGLITTNDTETVTGIPILSDIPGLGRLFSTKSKGVDRDELMIFIQPSIVNNEKSLSDLQLNMDNRYDVSDESRLFADGEVLPPLEEKKSDDKTSQKTKSLRPIHRR